MVFFVCFLTQLTLIDENEIIENYLLKKLCERNPSTFFHMKFKTLLFSKLKINMITSLTNIMNTLLQVKAEF